MSQFRDNAISLYFLNILRMKNHFFMAKQLWIPTNFGCFMKKILFFVFIFIFSFSAWTKISIKNHQLFIDTFSESAPLFLVNNMLKNQLISNLKLYENGNIHLISFSKKGGEVKIYSVDEKGYIYDIAPFSKYSISLTDKQGKFEFAEIPGRKYSISPKGFFLY